jgi:hypothetical protein
MTVQSKMRSRGNGRGQALRKLNTVRLSLLISNEPKRMPVIYIVCAAMQEHWKAMFETVICQPYSVYITSGIGVDDDVGFRSLMVDSVGMTSSTIGTLERALIC